MSSVHTVHIVNVLMLLFVLFKIVFRFLIESFSTPEQQEGISEKSKLILKKGIIAAHWNNQKLI